MVEAEEGGKIWFRGYVYSQKLKNKTQKTVKCYGVEDLLFRRKCPRYGLTRSFANYGSAWSGTWKAIYMLLESANPSLDGFGPRLGLLYLCNSAVPDGKIEHYDDANWTFKVAGFGTEFSTKTPITFNGRALTAQTSLVNCKSTADSYYRDSSNLYIHPNATDFPDATKGILCIENAFDTTLRLGTTSGDLDSESVQMPNFQASGEKYGNLVQAIADWHGLDIAVRYGADGYTRLDMVEDPGDDFVGMAGKATITEADCADVSSSPPPEVVPQVLFGLGYGGQDARQRVTKVDAGAEGFWLHGEYEYDDGFVAADNPFQSLVDAEWARLQTIHPTYEVETLGPIAVDPYDYVSLQLDYEPARILPVEKLEYESSGKFSLSLGNRDVDILDQFNSRGNDQCYAKDQLREGDSVWSASGDVNVTPGSFLDTDGGISSWGTPGSVSIGCTGTYVNGATRVILEISTEEEMYWNWVTLLKITCNDVANDNTILRFYKTLDSSGGIDITNICPPGSTRTFKFYAIYTRPQFSVPNPIVLHYTVKYVFGDNIAAFVPPTDPGYTTKLIYDRGAGARATKSPYFASAYYTFDGQLGRPAKLDCTGMTKANGKLIIDLSLIEGVASDLASGFISISSYGYSENPPGANEWRINLASILANISTTSKTFTIDLSSAVTVGGECDVANIHYFSFCAYGKGAIWIGWENAYFKYPTP
jgi:hypothetical protein